MFTNMQRWLYEVLFENRGSLVKTFLDAGDAFRITEPKWLRSGVVILTHDSVDSISRVLIVCSKLQDDPIGKFCFAIEQSRALMASYVMHPRPTTFFLAGVGIGVKGDPHKPHPNTKCYLFPLVFTPAFMKSMVAFCKREAAGHIQADRLLSQKSSPFRLQY
uniref:Uncharacterized protein n=1 Tax=candidate division WWE3 bacterium TaxID=2053526 RepID=A0A7C4TQU6_UNCKA